MFSLIIGVMLFICWCIL